MHSSKIKVNVKDQESKTNSHHDSCNRNAEIVKRMSTIEANYSALINTIMSGESTKFVSLLQKEGTNTIIYLNMRTKVGNTLLHLAALYGKIEISRCLIEKGGDLQAINNQGKSVLCYAALSGNSELTIFLLLKGANANAKDKEGKTVLDFAVMGGNIVIVRYLIEKKGFDVNTKDKKGNSPLHTACSSSVNMNRDKIVLFLLQKGACATDRNAEGETPLDIAKKHQNTKFIQSLLEHKISLDYRKKIVFLTSTPIVFILSSIAFLNVMADIHYINIMYTVITIVAVSVITSIILSIANSYTYKSDAINPLTGEINVESHNHSTPITTL